MRILISFVALAAVLAGCSTPNGDNSKAIHNTPEQRHVAGDNTRDNACSLLDRFPEGLAELSQNAETVISGNDSCVLALIDSITARYITSGEERYITYLGVVCDASDGYVADYMTDVMTTVFVSRADSSIHHLNKMGHKCLESMLIQGMRRQIHNPSGVIVEKETIDSVLGNILSSPGYLEGDKKYLKRISKDWEMGMDSQSK